jgi:chromosomal replication initiation ATPase DnaA
MQAAINAIIKEAEAKLCALTGSPFTLSIGVPKKDEPEKIMEWIISLVACEFDVTVAHIKSKRRTGKDGLVDARHCFCYLAHAVKGVRCRIVGEFINRDHTTVLNSCDKIENFLFTCDPISKSIDALLIIINSSKNNNSEAEKIPN